LSVSITEAAHAAERGHALLKRCEAAIRTASAYVAATIISAPRIILSVRVAAEGNGSDDTKHQN
jgi:hypothetical protein